MVTLLWLQDQVYMDDADLACMSYSRSGFSVPRELNVGKQKARIIQEMALRQHSPRFSSQKNFTKIGYWFYTFDSAG